ncbi:MAG TPA: outer membrane beta-barrel family protein, partial [Flavihumibacter sp.]
DIQFNFSRRINRPGFREINPYVDISDPLNLRKGNPELEPEFTNSFEINYNKNYSSGNLLISSYLRNNTEDITLFSDTLTTEEYEKLNNAAIDPNAILNTFINADRTNRMGVEVTWQQKIGKYFDLTPSLNTQYRDLKAEVRGVDMSNTGFNWSTKLMMNYKIVQPNAALLNNLSFQLSGEYQSPRVMAQGKTKEQYYMDFAIRKDFLKNNAGTITFNVNDVFNSRRFGNITDTENFYQDSYRRWNVRSVRLTFSYRFGRADLDIFKRRGGDRNGGGDMGEG